MCPLEDGRFKEHKGVFGLSILRRSPFVVDYHMKGDRITNDHTDRIAFLHDSST